MASHVISFSTSMFDLSAEPPNPINPIAGVSVLHWLRAALGSEYAVSEPAAEDWGWYVDVTRERAVYLVGASAEAGNDGEAHWILQIHRHRSLKDKLTGANGLGPDDPLTQRIARASRRRSGVSRHRGRHGNLKLRNVLRFSS
jgi:hypothetical protein